DLPWSGPRGWVICPGRFGTAAFFFFFFFQKGASRKWPAMGFTKRSNKSCVVCEHQKPFRWAPTFKDKKGRGRSDMACGRTCATADDKGGPGWICDRAVFVCGTAFCRSDSWRRRQSDFQTADMPQRVPGPPGAKMPAASWPSADPQSAARAGPV
ncbi:MAG: hypothetical protein BJ554DRAFT_1598, partial [Olpidium bornovanus]